MSGKRLEFWTAPLRTPLARPRRRGDRMMRRRSFITLLGGAAVWPVAAWAQQTPIPVVGFLDNRSAESIADRLRSFRQGLKETGYVEGENVAVDYRWADNQIDRLPMLAAELAQRKVAVIAATTTQAAMAAKAATTSIPVVFSTGFDPVALGLVASLARPGGNLTGVNFLNNELVAKQLDFLLELVPSANRVAALVNPANVRNASAALADIHLTARAKIGRASCRERGQMEVLAGGVEGTGAESE